MDPSESFVAAARQRFPGVDVQVGSAESLPFDDGTFDAALAQLVVHFMTDPEAGLREMGGYHARRPGRGLRLEPRVERRTPVDVPGGGPGRGPAGRGRGRLRGRPGGSTRPALVAAGLEDVRAAVLTVRVPFRSFDDWWQPYLLGVGPAGQYLAGMDDERREAVRRECLRRAPAGSFTLSASAWTVAARVGR